MKRPNAWSMMLLGTLVGLALPAAAQAPAREGNTWDWRHHEPHPGAVRQEERDDGLITPQAAQHQNQQVNDLANKLLRQEGVPPRQAGPK